MKMLFSVAVVLLVTKHASSQLLFFPGSREPKLQAGTLQIPGFFADNEQAPLVVGETSEKLQLSVPQQYVDTQARFSAPSKLESIGLVDSSSYGNAENRLIITNQEAGGVPFSSSGATLTLPNPFQRVITVQENKIEYKLVPPLCVACTCLIGKKLCADVGGVYAVTTGMVGTDTCSSTTICVVPPPPTTSACDPNCKKPSATCSLTAAAGLATNTLCEALTGDDVAQCKTPCAEVAAGAIVECNSRLASSNVISAVPPLCSSTARFRRDANSFEVPTISSSQENPGDRHQRLLKPFANFGGARVVPVTVTSTSTITGAVTATYVPQGNCLPSDLPTCRF